ncbi:MAG: ABC transporter permease [Bacteroidales bacterium]|jgi:phospholipid/cholesterol/gamma-HCH transport system permease protein|nr:ABC transporter permease [Bacteroidales bacterium]MCK9448741.1 ABC transporter permease [Bacteroidales bacterium]MDD3702051.1 ABC transporter permease [Bacteroidales bacterium]MDY0369702.1 ABC transporter permease [Bacteroidales bacterium]
MLRTLGEYVLLMFETFKRPDKGPVFRRQLLVEIIGLGIDSISIVAFISVFTGAIIAIQTAYNIDSPLIPLKMVGFTTRQMMILEFSPTVISLILAGKVGSRIASEIGSMRVTEQIDALRVMGVNPANFLILPKITASMLFNPVLIVFSMVVGILGGWVACIVTGLVPSVDFIEGLRGWFEPFTVTYAIIKTLVFAFIIASVSGFLGYNLKGGSVEVGKASTRAVVVSSILIILFDLILTQLLLV